jgi:hypothetical protein
MDPSDAIVGKGGVPLASVYLSMIGTQLGDRMLVSLPNLGIPERCVWVFLSHVFLSSGRVAIVIIHRLNAVQGQDISVRDDLS